MEVAIQCPVGNESVRMIGRAAQHRIQTGVVQRLTPIRIDLRLREMLHRIRQVQLVDITDCDDVLILERPIVGMRTARGTDQCDV